MMTTVWKFTSVQVDDTAKVEVQGAHVIQWLHAEPMVTMGHLTLWAIVEGKSESYSETATFICRGTGHPFTGAEGKHFATVMDAGLVWHLFEEVQG